MRVYVTVLLIALDIPLFFCLCVPYVYVRNHYFRQTQNAHTRTPLNTRYKFVQTYCLLFALYFICRCAFFAPSNAIRRLFVLPFARCFASVTLGVISNFLVPYGVVLSPCLIRFWGVWCVSADLSHPVRPGFMRILFQPTKSPCLSL